MLNHRTPFLTDAQLKSEIQKCEFCEEKPCKEACPVDCSPADFIMAAKQGRDQDYQRAAAIIFGHNPLGGVCGALCPDYLCMKACVHKMFDRSVDIPAVQATLIQKAKDLDRVPEFIVPAMNGMKVAILGAGPGGLGAAVLLAQKGYEILIYEREERAGGMCNLIPDFRFDKEILKSDVEFIRSLGKINFQYGVEVEDPKDLIDNNVGAVIVCTGLDEPYSLDIPGEEFAIPWSEYLRNGAERYKGDQIAVIGGGGVALDCALLAKKSGASQVDLICLENPNEMPLTSREREWLLDEKIGIMNRFKLCEILADRRVKGIRISKVKLPAGKMFHPENIVIEPETFVTLKGYDQVVLAIGSKSRMPVNRSEGLFYAGDLVNGPTTVVEAVASGKNVALEADAYLQKRDKPVIQNRTKSRSILKGRDLFPVSLGCEFFGRKIESPFILSAAPPTDGYEQMKKAYETGWAGGVMKTAFDDVPVHIPSEYMFVLNRLTYGNFDNVSGHPLDRVCEEVGRLVRDYPEKLTIASTGGSVTGDDKADKRVWQSNTRKLEDAGVMAIEYSLSCPQGGDGSKGDIVSQDPELTSKIIDWVLEVSNPEVPKLFKLTGAVTSIYPILKAIEEVFKNHPNKKAGVTLANTFPALAFKREREHLWDEGIIIGLSGEGIQNISNLTLARASKAGVAISGNGGPMDYKAAADFLALGAETVQFCSIVMEYGYGIIDELQCGLSYLLKSRGFSSVRELIGCALPDPVTEFMDLPQVKKISSVDRELCEQCGNCTRCPYMAITFDEEKFPVTDPALCIGCSFCAQTCFSGALSMRERTEEELAVLKEG